MAKFFKHISTLFQSKKTASNNEVQPFNLNMLTQKYVFLPNGVGINYYHDSDLPLKFLNQTKYNQISIFLHGLTNSALTWRPLMPYFKEESTLNIYLDLPGHGDSQRGDFKYDIPFYSETLEWFIEELGLKNVSLIGHSLGGQIAINYALLNERNVENLILIAPAGFETFSFIEKTMLERAALFPITLSNYLKVLRPTYKLNNFIPVEQILQDDTFLKVISKSVKGMLRNPVFTELSELDLPVLIIFGKDDKAIPNPILHPTLSTIEVAYHGARQIRQGKLEIIDNGGHFVHLQQPELVAEIMHEFLFELPSSSK